MDCKKVFCGHKRNKEICKVNSKHSSTKIFYKVFLQSFLLSIEIFYILSTSRKMLFLILNQHNPCHKTILQNIYYVFSFSQITALFSGFCKIWFTVKTKERKLNIRIGFFQVFSTKLLRSSAQSFDLETQYCIYIKILRMSFIPQFLKYQKSNLILNLKKKSLQKF